MSTRGGTGIKVWIHPESGDLCLSYQVYVCLAVNNEEHKLPLHITVQAYQYLGEAIENKNGVTCIFHESYLKHFEYVGDL